MNADSHSDWPQWPEPAHVREMRQSLAAVRAYATQHATGLSSLANDSISARAVLAMLPEEENC